MVVQWLALLPTPVGVNMSVNGCLSLCVSPVIDWGPVKSLHCLSPSVSMDLLQHPCKPQSEWMDGWMDGWLDGRMDGVLN